MSLLGWIIFGALTGWIAAKLVNKRGQGCLINMVLGLVGAVVGGFIFRQLMGFTDFHFDIWSMFVAVIGAVVVLLIYHAASGRRR